MKDSAGARILACLRDSIRSVNRALHVTIAYLPAADDLGAGLPACLYAGLWSCLRRRATIHLLVFLALITIPANRFALETASRIGA